MNREGRAASWSGLIHGGLVILLALLWGGSVVREKRLVTIDFSMSTPAARNQPAQQQTVKRAIAQPPHPLPAIPPAEPARREPPPVSVEPPRPVAAVASEAVLPYAPPPPPAPVVKPLQPQAVSTAVPEPTPASRAEEKKKRYLKEHFAYIRDSIMQKAAYPPMARKMGWSGVVTVRFVVEEDGSVSGLRVEKGCPFQLLDRSAVESVKTAAPFPKPPVRAELVVPVRYSLQ